MTNDIYKTRSCPACITAALNIYSSNFSKIFRATWLWILTYSIFCGFSAFIGSASIMNLPVLFHAFAIFAILAVTFILDIHITSCVVSMLSEEKIRTIHLKILKIKLLEILVFFFVGLCIACSIYGVTHIGFIQKLPMATSVIVITATTIIALTITAIILAPLVYSTTKYVLEPGVTFHNVFGKSYCVGFRRLGFLFSILIVVILIGITLWILLCIPACITFIASNVDGFNVASGDTTGLPPYFSWFNFMSSSIMAFIMQYMAIWIMFTVFYAYGSIESYNKNITEKN